MWLGEQITAKGVGNGISIIIFAGIVAAIPNAVNQIYAQQIEGAGEQLFITVSSLCSSLVLVLLQLLLELFTFNKHYVKFQFNMQNVLLDVAQYWWSTNALTIKS